jgi:hypothetical protein
MQLTADVDATSAGIHAEVIKVAQSYQAPWGIRVDVVQDAHSSSILCFVHLIDTYGIDSH